MIKGKATICVVNYKTLDLTRLCLRSIRKFTKYPYDIIVVDNDSQDDSLEYLKSLNWIRLIEQRGRGNLGGGYAHAAGLDLCLANCNTEFFVSLHSDSFVKKEDWLTDIISYFGNDENIACVGSGKIDLTPMWKAFLKKAADLRAFKRKIFGKPDHIDKFRYYNRTICCVYRTDILRKEKLSFLMGREKGFTGGKKLYFELVDRGYKTVELAPSVMSQYVIHLAHATAVINQQEFTLRRKTIRKYNRIVERVMSRTPFQNILADQSLDR